MRRTSVRRNPSRRGSKYNGEGIRATKVETPTLLREGLGTTICPDCEASVRRLVSGRPTSHAPGGYAINPEKGRYACPSSGTARLATIEVSPVDGLPYVSILEANKQGLTTGALIATKLGSKDKNFVKTLPNFPKPVARLEQDGNPGRPHLFRVSEVQDYFAKTSRRKNLKRS